eukprot:4278763-Lingulodinium_polyedra.AAC.1
MDTLLATQQRHWLTGISPSVTPIETAPGNRRHLSGGRGRWRTGPGMLLRSARCAQRQAFKVHA